MFREPLRNRCWISLPVQQPNNKKMDEDLVTVHLRQAVSVMLQRHNARTLLKHRDPFSPAVDEGPNVDPQNKFFSAVQSARKVFLHFFCTDREDKRVNFFPKLSYSAYVY